MARSILNFYRSFPREWQIILTGLSISLVITAGFQLAFIVADFQRGGDMPPYVPLIGIIPLAALLLLRDLAAPENKYPLGNGLKYLYGGCIGILTPAMMMYFYFEDAHQSKKDAKAEWAISQLCTEDGDVRTDNSKICEALLPSFNGHICMLGATPKTACEVRLRERLDFPENGPASF